MAEGAARIREWTDLFEAAESGDEAAQDEIILRTPRAYDLPDYLPGALTSRHANVYKLYRTRKEEQSVRRLLEELAASHDAKIEIECLVHLLQLKVDIWATAEVIEERLGFSWGGLHDRLEHVVHSIYEELIANREDPEGFQRLWDFIFRTRRIRDRYDSYWVSGDLLALGIETLPYSDDWNDLIARYYATPAIESFVDLPDRGPGDVRLLAAQAVDDNDLTAAQVALAYCNANERTRQAVGDVLTADLAHLVNHLRAVPVYVEEVYKVED
ncbi:MAG: hypothetical protein Q7R60_00185 [bacterium]|nr:hypothetical protein [bacterium]